MANPWFRFYSEFMSDPKVQLLTEFNQRRLVMLFCMRCNGDVTLQDVHVTFTLRISEQEWSESKARFVASGFIDSENNLLNWNKRQYVSDSSTARVAKHRALQKQENVTTCNVTVTPPEQNRTEQKQKKPLSEYSDEFEKFWDAYPKKTGKGGAWKSWKTQKPDINAIISTLSWQTKSTQWTKDGGQFIPMPATYLNQRRWEDTPTGEQKISMLVCPNGFPFSDWMKASQQEKAEIMNRHG